MILLILLVLLVRLKPPSYFGVGNAKLKFVLEICCFACIMEHKQDFYHQTNRNQTTNPKLSFSVYFSSKLVMISNMQPFQCIETPSEASLLSFFGVACVFRMKQFLFNRIFAANIIIDSNNIGQMSCKIFARCYSTDINFFYNYLFNHGLSSQIE